MKSGFWVVRLFCLVLIGCGAGACAVADVPATAPPPVTIHPVPTWELGGRCEETRVLEEWLQRVTFIKKDFMDQLTNAASVNRGELGPMVAEMLKKRDSAARLIVPDCANEPHMLFVDAMNKSLDRFQLYVNENVGMGNIVGDTERNFEVVDVYLLELTDRLELQYQQENQ